MIQLNSSPTPFTSQRFCGSDNSFVDTAEDFFQIYFPPTDKFPSRSSDSLETYRHRMMDKLDDAVFKALHEPLYLFHNVKKEF